MLIVERILSYLMLKFMFDEHSIWMEINQLVEMEISKIKYEYLYECIKSASNPKTLVLRH